ncbi:DEAD-domain-containing protein [Scleroderma citrinum]
MLAGYKVQGAFHPHSDGAFLSSPLSAHCLVDPCLPNGANIRNNLGIRLRLVSDLPDRYRGVFKFGVFNAIQSTCMDKIISGIFWHPLYINHTYVGLAPTGSGKTVLFDLAIIRMLTTQAANNPQSTKCVYVAPSKALCTEKHREWNAKFGGLGIKSCELTGDTISFGADIWGEARNSQIMYAEKWDSLTRNWGEHSRILSKIKLFLVDEVHILNESRGSTLEVIVSRMKMRGSGIRFLLVSATVPNIEDIANWIGSNEGNSPATVFQFGEEFRPCQLQKFVYGIPRPKAQNDFAYAHALDRRLFGLLQQHSQQKPILVFCPTRKGTVDTAKQLATDYEEAMKARNSLPWSLPTRIDANFHDKDLATLTRIGVAVHHAGLNLDDRKVVEDLYLQKTLRVLVATSTLAVGVNLPAHIVVIKGVKLYHNGQTKEYSDLEILQMMGRAGRPQFDNEGIAIILCEPELQNKYRALVQGTTTIESSLHRNLVEHLNSEICLGAITDHGNAKDWLCGSFFFCRIQKNPQYYDIGKVENETWQEKIDAIVMQAVSALRDTQLITYNEKDGSFCSTQYGDIMSKCYVHQTTMRSILELPDSANIREIMYEKIRQYNDIRFPIRKVSTAKDKIFLLVQAMLAGLPLNSPEFRVPDSQPYLEAISIFRHFSRIVTAITEVAIVKQCGAQVKYALELTRCLHAKAWEDHPLVLRQIEHIGEKSLTNSNCNEVLAEHGINSIQKLVQTSSSRIEELLNRRPPFGSEVLAAARGFPRYFLILKEIRSMPSDGKNPVEVKLLVECGLIPNITATQNAKDVKRIGTERTTLLTLTSDQVFVDFRRIATKALIAKREFTVTAHLTKPSQAINVYISSELDLQGLENVSDFWEMDISDDEGIPAVPVEDLTAKPRSKESASRAHTQYSCPDIYAQQPKERSYKKRPDGKYECNHPCKDKLKCRHYCCKEGLAEPPRSQKKKRNGCAEQLEVPANQQSMDICNLLTKRSSRKKGGNQATRMDRPKPAERSLRQEGIIHSDLGRPRNNPSTRGQHLTFAGSSKDEKRTKLVPNFDLELASLQLESEPFFGPNVAAEDDDDELQTISEILKRDRSQTPESNYSNSEVDAMIRQMPLDMYQPHSRPCDTERSDERKSKRQRLLRLEPNLDNGPPIAEYPKTVNCGTHSHQEVILSTSRGNTNIFPTLVANVNARIHSQSSCYTTVHVQPTWQERGI